MRRGLLERESELRRIGEVIDRAVHGVGDLLLIEGPAGIGKSAILEAASEIASECGMRCSPRGRLCLSGSSHLVR